MKKLVIDIYDIEWLDEDGDEMVCPDDLSSDMQVLIEVPDDFDDEDEDAIRDKVSEVVMRNTDHDTAWFEIASVEDADEAEIDWNCIS